MREDDPEIRNAFADLPPGRDPNKELANARDSILRRVYKEVKRKGPEELKGEIQNLLRTRRG